MRMQTFDAKTIAKANELLILRHASQSNPYAHDEKIKRERYMPRKNS
jgi:hypothetical protein